MIAKVVVNHDSKQVDKLFDYAVDKDLEDVIRIGSRVIVPFGASNKHTEGYVMELAKHSLAKNLKSIIKHEDVVFDEKMCSLIFWMREKYMCSFLDIIKTVVPSGISIKPEEWIVLKDDDYKDEISLKLSENGGAMEINRLLSFFENNITAKIKRLCEKGVIKKEYREPNHITDKVIRVASVNVEAEETERVLELLKRAKVQYRMFEILSQNERISLADLVQFSEGNYSAVQALEKKGYIKIYDITVNRSPLRRATEQNAEKPVLTEEQDRARVGIEKYLEEEAYKGILVHGVTGSGKTEVYMRSIEKCLENGKSAIMLVPEISLTPQMVSRFVKRFGERIAVFHSGLSLGERYDEWKKMRDGKASVVIGARSAVFAPFKDIGIIIIDEEHEGTYKSDMTPRYNTKEVAMFRAKQNNAVLLLASATPEVSDYYKAQLGEYELIELKKRVNNRKMPEVDIIDMRKELEEGNRSVFSRKLIEELEKNLERKEQSILFLNRRGYSTFVSCRSCGFVAKCPNCNISLTYHKYSDTLKCHYCGYVRKNYETCPACKSKYIRYFGGGTQKVEEEIKKIFPDISTIRMDVDTTAKMNSHEKILEKFEKEKIDVLVGTQMVTKGLDFDNVTLVGVISADVMLNVQDFRSGERTFDLIEQVTGRAGRAEKEGRAVIQTYSPEHYAVTMAKEHNYNSFYDYEILTRKAMWYPPYCEMVSVLFSGVNENQVSQCAKLYAKHLEPMRKLSEKVQILGPIPAALSKINNKYRWRILIKCTDADKLNSILTAAKEAVSKNMNYKDISIVIDKNPNNAY